MHKPAQGALQMIEKVIPGIKGPAPTSGAGCGLT
jgi:hypothetical protein